MLDLKWCLFVIACLLPSPVAAQTDVGGSILQDTTWPASMGPYTLTSPIVIGSNATLTIEPGCEIRIGSTFGIIVGSPALGAGTLVAIGTETDPIVFTSSSEEALPGDWTSIVFSTNNVGTVLDPETGEYVSGSIVKHAEIEFAGGGTGDTGAITILSSAVVVDHVEVRDIANHGVYVDLDVKSELQRITNARFFRCHATKDDAFFGVRGGGINIRDAKHLLSNILIEDCSASDYGGGLATASAPQSTFESITIRNCHTIDEAGGAWLGAPEATITDLTIDSCTSDDKAGLRMAGDNSVIDRLTITNCGGDMNTDIAGANIDSDNLLLTSAYFGYNKTGTQSSSSLAGLFLAGNDAILENCLFEGNEAMNGGGALTVAGYRATIRDCVFRANKVTRIPSNGVGAIGVYRTDVVIEGCLFDSNVSTGIAGAVFVESGSTSIRDCVFLNNLSLSDGGAIFVDGDRLSITNSEFRLNSAIRGGAIYFSNQANYPSLAGNPKTGEHNTFIANADENGYTIYNKSPYRADGSNDFSLSYNCWGNLTSAQVDAAIYDYFDDTTSSIAAVSSIYPCTCPADTNGDGMLSPADFSAWITAFNTVSPACDQNDDGMCSPADFSAWVTNYNAGC